MSDANALIDEYISVRDKRSSLKRQFEEEDAVLKTRLDGVEQKLLELCKTTGSTGLKTEAGTATRSVRTHYWATDWESMHEFIRERGAFDLLERRISQNNMRVFLETHPDMMPKGLNVDQRYVITVRRKTA